MTNNDKITDFLNLAIHDTFEQLTFSEAEERAVQASLDNLSIIVNIETTAPIKGSILLRASQALVADIAQTILSQESNFTSDILLDVGGEILNILAGKFLRSLALQTQICAFGLPQSGEIKITNNHKATYKKQFAVNDEPIIVEFFTL